MHLRAEMQSWPSNWSQLHLSLHTHVHCCNSVNLRSTAVTLCSCRLSTNKAVLHCLNKSSSVEAPSRLQKDLLWRHNLQRKLQPAALPTMVHSALMQRVTYSHCLSYCCSCHTSMIPPGTAGSVAAATAAFATACTLVGGTKAAPPIGSFARDLAGRYPRAFSRGLPAHAQEMCSQSLYSCYEC